MVEWVGKTVSHSPLGRTVSHSPSEKICNDCADVPTRRSFGGVGRRDEGMAELYRPWESSWGQRRWLFQELPTKGAKLSTSQLRRGSRKLRDGDGRRDREKD